MRDAIAALAAVWWLWLPVVIVPALYRWLDVAASYTWSSLEAFWTAASIGMLPTAAYALWDAVADVRAAWWAHREGRATLGQLTAALTWLPVGILCLMIFAGFAIVGMVAGNLPPRVVEVGDATVQASHVSAVVFLVIGGVASALLLLILWGKRMLYRMPRARAEARHE